MVARVRVVRRGNLYIRRLRLNVIRLRIDQHCFSEEMSALRLLSPLSLR